MGVKSLLVDIKYLRSIFGSYSKAQEIIYLWQGAKEVVRQGYYSEELPAVKKFCQENNLFFVLSKFKVVLADADNLGSNSQFSNKGLRINGNILADDYNALADDYNADSQPGMYFIYISKDELRAYQAAYFEQVGDERKLGEILGYPQCCIDFFLKNFNSDNSNLQLVPTNIYTNISQRDKDVVLISHFPCSSDCQQSVALGKKFLEVLMFLDKERAERVVRKLDIKNINY